MRGRAARISPYDFGSFEASHDFRLWHEREVLTHLPFIEVAYELGLRIVQMTYNTATSVGSGCYESNDVGFTTFQKIDISEFESSHPSQSVRSLLAVSRRQEIYRTYRDLAGSKRVSAHEDFGSFAISEGFCGPVSGPQIAISKMAIRRLGSKRVETGSIASPAGEEAGSDMGRLGFDEFRPPVFL
jgi:hypothetical protein